MWVFFVVFLMSQVYQLKNKIVKALDVAEKEEEETKSEMMRLKVNEQKLRNSIAYERLALDQEKRHHAQALHQLKKNALAKEFEQELRQPAAWFSQSA